MVQLVQARHFADREQYLDAVARADEVRDAVARALADEADPARAARLRRLLERVERDYETYRAAFEKWRSEAEAKRQARLAHAADEMSRPLPIPPPR